MVHLLRVVISYIICSFNENIGRFCIQILASLKDARAVVEDGGCTILGYLPDILYKSDKFGLGFTLKAQKEVWHARVRGPPLCISNNEVNALEDTDSDGDLDDWIFPTIDGGLNKWKAKDFISISFIQE